MFSDQKRQELTKTMEAAEKQMQADTLARADKSAKMQSLYQSMKEADFKIEDDAAFDTDFENASLDGVKDSESALNKNIARLINSLDGTTTSLGAEFSTMRQNTMSEKIIGIFSKNKANEMRSERIESASIEENLSDLIAQSNGITVLLQGQRDELEEQLSVGQANLKEIVQARAEVVKELEAVKANMSEASMVLIDLEEQRDGAETPAQRTEIESKLQEANQTYNEFKDQEAILLNQSMTMERYINLNKSNVDSLTNQLTNQKVLIQKLKTDTEQRQVIYASLETSLKTAEQQETAHRINQIGVETDQKVQEIHAAIGASTNNALADMMEGHQGQMQATQDILERKQRADQLFFERFGKVDEDHSSENY
jgi:chromosome segregation ATPase